MKNLTWQNPEQLFVAQELINKVKSKCCGIKDIEKVKVQAKLNKTYKKVDNWVKVVGTISAALSLGAIFNYPELTPIGAVGLFSSNVGEKINEYFKNKYRWVNFVN